MILTGASLKKAIVSVASATDNEIVAAVTNKALRVYKFELLTRGATVITWKSNSTAKTGALSFSTGGAWFEDMLPSGEPLFETASGEALKLALGSAVQVDGMVWYLEA